MAIINTSETCPYCGCVLKVSYEQQTDCAEQAIYNCPECNFINYIPAALSLDIILVTPRTDGKNDRFS